MFDNMPMLALPPPPPQASELFRGEPEVSSTHELRAEGKQSNNNCLSRQSSTEMGVQAATAAAAAKTMKEEDERRSRWRQKRQSQNNSTKSIKRLTGDRWFSDRSRDIFLRADGTRKGEEEEEEAEVVGTQVISMNDKAGAIDTCLHERLLEQQIGSHYNCCQSLSRLEQRSTSSSSLLKFIINNNITSLSATSVCLLQSSATRSLPQLMLIMMLLIMIPLSVFKCPCVAVAAAAQQQPTATNLDHQALSIAHYKLPHEPPLLNGATVGTQGDAAWPQSEFPAAAEAAAGERVPDINYGGKHGRQRDKADVERSRRSAHFEIGCHQLSAAWSYFRGAYPSLASHLFSLALTKGDERLVAQTAKAVGRLLDEAERLVHEQLMARGGVPDAVQRSNSLRPAASAWLSRVTANPLYSKIVQNFQNQHQKQLLDRLTSKSATTAEQPDSQRYSSPQDGASSPVYGRVIHYPHEASKETSPGKTLDKLKQLSQQQQRSEKQTNEIDRMQLGEDPIESNRIPLVAADGDGEPWPAASGNHRLQVGARFEPDSDVAEAARNKYVYGDVLLRPNPKSSDPSHQYQQSAHHKHRHSSLGALRQLSDDLERSMRQQNQLADDESKLTQQAHNKNEPTSESYGRVLVSPPNLSTDRSLATTGERLHRVEDQVVADVQATGGSSRGLDELASQQHDGSVAASEDAPAAPANEFEGVWYSGPIQQVEVRQLRRDNSVAVNGAKDQAEDVVVVRTTSKPNDVILVD